MAKFVVFEHKVLGRKAVKIGFSAGGFFFTLIWTLIHKMWVAATVLFIWAMVAAGMDSVLSNQGGSPFGAMVAQFLFYHLPAGLYFGFQGNSLLQSALSKQGYTKLSELEAMSPEDALAKVADAGPKVASTPSTGYQNQPADLAEQISKLNQLKQSGAITEDEFRAAKSKLIG